MISTEKVKELVGDAAMSDERAEAIRAACCDLVELIVAAYQHKKAAIQKKGENGPCSETNDRATLEVCKPSSTPE